MKKIFKTIYQSGIFFTLSLFSSPSVFAYTECVYPITQRKYLWWIKDAHGLTNVDVKQTFREAQPVVTCLWTGSSFPKCSTPWGGLVDIHKVSYGDWYHISGFKDKSNDLLEFSMSRDGSSNSPMQIHPSKKFKVVKCGSLVTNEWVQIHNDYDKYNYYWGANGSGRIRRAVMRDAKYVTYGTPVKIYEGGGNF